MLETWSWRSRRLRNSRGHPPHPRCCLQLRIATNKNHSKCSIEIMVIVNSILIPSQTTQQASILMAVHNAIRPFITQIQWCCHVNKCDPRHISTTGSEQEHGSLGSISFQGHLSIDVGNWYFTPRQHVLQECHISFSPAIDPDNILAEALREDFVHTKDNEVEYYKVHKEAGRTR